VVGDGNGIVLPGLVNAHTHLTEGLLLPGMAETATCGSGSSGSSIRQDWR
jgi:cytosine/adenosine deaminase-related metal-dependent hydrolase